MPKTPDVPQWSKDVQEKFLKFKPGGPSVEEARRQMVQSAESAKTFVNKEGSVPRFIQAEQQKQVYAEDAKMAQERHDREPTAGSRGVGGNTPVNAPKREHPIENILENAQGITPEPERLAQTVATVERQIQGATPASLAAAATAPALERQPAVEPEHQRKRIEDKKFTVEIFKDGKEWVAELTYKNGAGMERFTANSKDELITKLAVGKAHGTIKVQQVNHRIKEIVLGNTPDTWDVFWKEACESSGMTLEEFKTISEPVKQWHQDTAQAAWITEFKALYPDYYATSENFQRIGKYLNSRGIPLTLHNLELAYRDLTAEEILDERPQPETVPSVTTVSVPAQVATPLTEDSAVEAETVSTVPVVVAQPVRKRGVTSLVPGQSSAVSVTETAPAKTEEGAERRELTEEEARRLPMSELARYVKKDRKFPRTY